MYYRGTLQQFNDWETVCRVAEGIPLDDSGKINYINGQPAPNKQRTIRYANCIPNPVDANDVIWNAVKYIPSQGVQISEAEAILDGFLPDPEVI